jgi:nucleoside-diphosphate-sugar epimerase
VIRPGDVYGPGSRPWTILPVEAIAAGRFFLPAMGRGIHSPIYIDDLLDGVLLAAGSDAAAGGVFTISGGIGITCNEFFGNYSRMLGRPAARRVPTPLAMALAAIPEAAAWFAGGTTELRRSSVRYDPDRHLLDREGAPGARLRARGRPGRGHAPHRGLAT